MLLPKPVEIHNQCLPSPSRLPSTAPQEGIAEQLAEPSYITLPRPLSPSLLLSSSAPSSLSAVRYSPYCAAT